MQFKLHDDNDHTIEWHDSLDWLYIHNATKICDHIRRQKWIFFSLFKNMLKILSIKSFVQFANFTSPSIRHSFIPQTIYMIHIHFGDSHVIRAWLIHFILITVFHRKCFSILSTHVYILNIVYLYISLI